MAFIVNGFAHVLGFPAPFAQQRGGFADTVTTAAFVALSFMGANAYNRANPGLALLLRLIGTGAGLYWLFSRCAPNFGGAGGGGGVGPAPWPAPNAGWYGGGWQWPRYRQQPVYQQPVYQQPVYQQPARGSSFPATNYGSPNQDQTPIYSAPSRRAPPVVVPQVAPPRLAQPTQPAQPASGSSFPTVNFGNPNSDSTQIIAAPSRRGA